jgi:hypothetical protein
MFTNERAFAIRFPLWLVNYSTIWFRYGLKKIFVQYRRSTIFVAKYESSHLFIPLVGIITHGIAHALSQRAVHGRFFRQA